MKILVIANNHNSIAAIDLCVNLRQLDSDISVIAICSPLIVQEHSAELSRRGVQHFVAAPDGIRSPVNGRGSNANTFRPRRRTDIRELARFGRVVPFYFLAREQFAYRRLQRTKALALGFLQQHRPDVVVSISDRSHDYVESPILWAARQSAIPVIVPFVTHYDIDSAVVYRTGPDGKVESELRPIWPPSPYKWLSYLRFRKQLHKGIFFQAPYVLNAHRRAGTLSSYPWWVGNGCSDIVCVDSRHTAEKYECHGVDPAKIRVTGHVGYDRVFASANAGRTLQKKLAAEYGFDTHKALLVFSMPQYAEQGYMSWQQHWREIEIILGAICSCGENVLISLHPRSNRIEYLRLEGRFPCRFANEPLSDIIGAADLFLASNSSTFVWSALCGIPAIAVKSPIELLYGYLNSVHAVYDSTQIPNEVRRVLDGQRPDFAGDWHLLSRTEVFDGLVNEHFLQLLKGLSRAAKHAGSESEIEVGV